MSMAGGPVLRICWVWGREDVALTLIVQRSTKIVDFGG